MTEMVLRQWNDRTIRQREDGYFCLTDMAQSSGKLMADWLRLKSTKEYLQELESVMGIPITELLQVIQGGDPQDQGTWGHRRVAIRFAQWCDVKFAIQVDDWVEEILVKGYAIGSHINNKQVESLQAECDRLQRSRLALLDSCALLEYSVSQIANNFMILSTESSRQTSKKVRLNSKDLWQQLMDNWEETQSRLNEQSDRLHLKVIVNDSKVKGLGGGFDYAPDSGMQGWCWLEFFKTEVASNRLTFPPDEWQRVQDKFAVPN